MARDQTYTWLLPLLCPAPLVPRGFSKTLCIQILIPGSALRTQTHQIGQSCEQLRTLISTLAHCERDIVNIEVSLTFELGFLNRFLLFRKEIITGRPSISPSLLFNQ